MTILANTEWDYTAFGATGLESLKSVRRIPKSYRNVTGIVASSKSNDQARYESTLERDLLSYLEFCPEVDSYTVQPVTLEWVDSSDKNRTYTPDTYVNFNKIKGISKTPWLCEVKYRSELRDNWDDLRPKFKAAVAFAVAQGWRFKILTEIEIRTPYMKNAQFLLRYRYPIPDADWMQLLVNRLIEMRETTPIRLIKSVFKDEWKQAQSITVLWYLIATFQVGTDLHSPLTMDSPIWWLS